MSGLSTGTEVPSAWASMKVPIKMGTFASVSQIMYRKGRFRITALGSSGIAASAADTALDAGVELAAAVADGQAV